tara:strand:- start:70 stop:450 length:381 start_codon:yes stop_codon:yes gene_type:complete
MELIEIMAIIVVHWIADFVLQTDKQAKGKSSSMKYLLLHTYTYSMLWVVVLPIYAMYLGDNYLWWSGSKFIIITFMAHTVQDYYTSRLNTYLWNKGDVHNFFVSVGLDQVLHYGQLFATYYWLFKS